MVPQHDLSKCMVAKRHEPDIIKCMGLAFWYHTLFPLCLSIDSQSDTSRIVIKPARQSLRRLRR